jgi:hypothetical protein
MAATDNNIWFSTFTNLVCGILSARGIKIPIITDIPTFNGVKVCEKGFDNYETPVGTHRANWRPPHIYKYNIEKSVLTEETPQDEIIYNTLGLRSAIAYDDMIFFLGLPLNKSNRNSDDEQGMIMYAYDDITGKYLGHHSFQEFSNSREWVKTPYGLYVIATGTRRGAVKSAVLKWIGTRNDPFKFDIVGNIPSSAANMAYHNDRLFVNTWTSFKGLRMKGLEIFMSPKLAENGLSVLDENKWEKVWDIEDYEPDKATASTYTGGAMESYGGFLYWGTMNMPFTGIGGHLLKYGILPTDIILAYLASFRPVSIFRGKNFGTPNQKVEVLYGLSKMPVYEPLFSKDNKMPIGRWIFKENKIGKPIFGSAGFGNPFNSYTWSMEVYDNKLFIGTMDYSYNLAVNINTSLTNLLRFVIFKMPTLYELNTKNLPFRESYDYGADLYYFRDNNSPAVAVTRDGFGNYSNFGIRTMVANKSGLYIGISNPFNLLTNKDGNAPEGGFEIRKLKLNQ